MMSPGATGLITSASKDPNVDAIKKMSFLFLLIKFIWKYHLQKSKNNVQGRQITKLAELSSNKMVAILLTHLPLALHICVNETDQHWFR